MKVLLIGGSGFIGPATAAALQKSGHHVTVFHPRQDQGARRRKRFWAIASFFRIASSSSASRTSTWSWISFSAQAARRGS